MLESKFVEQNKQKWSELETLLSKPSQEPEKLSEFFVQVSEDLSYSRTHYANRSVRQYLNMLTQRIFNTVYSNKKNRWKQLVYFWRYQLPATMFHARTELLVSFSIFLIAMGIGAFSCKSDPGFASHILGDDYVSMTLENIKKGDPMAVYKKSEQTGMFLGITINNIRVSIIVFVMGLLLGLGTAGFLFSNGIMVGTFQYFFIQKGLFMASFLTIWLHGALEISSIVLAGAAGFCLGKGIVFPGTYSRFQSFQIGARKGITIMLGIIPLFVMAGFIEGFLTRYTETPNIIRLLLIICSFVFIIFYFVIYPGIVIKDPLMEKFTLSEKPESIQLQSENASSIRNFGEIFSATLGWAFSNLKQVSLPLFLISGAFAAWWVFYVNPEEAQNYNFTTNALTNNILQYFDLQRYHLSVFIPAAISFSLLETYIYFLHWKSLHKQEIVAIKLLIIQFLQNLLIISVLLSFLLMGGAGIVFFALLLPLKIFWSATNLKENTNPLFSFLYSLTLQSESWMMVIGQYFIMIMMVIILSVLGTSPVVWVYFEVMAWNFSDSSIAVQQISRWLVSFLTLFTILFSYTFVFINSLYLYENLKEINSGHIMRTKIAELRIKRGYVR